MADTAGGGSKSCASGEVHSMSLLGWFISTSGPRAQDDASFTFSPKVYCQMLRKPWVRGLACASSTLNSVVPCPRHLDWTKRLPGPPSTLLRLSDGIATRHD